MHSHVSSGHASGRAPSQSLHHTSSGAPQVRALALYCSWWAGHRRPPFTSPDLQPTLLYLICLQCRSAVRHTHSPMALWPPSLPHRGDEDLLPELARLVSRRRLEVRVLLEQLLNHAVPPVLQLVTRPACSPGQATRHAHIRSGSVMGGPQLASLPHTHTQPAHTASMLVPPQ